MNSETRVTSEAPGETEVVAKTAPPSPPSTYREVLHSLVGKTITIVNPESFEEGPLGNRLTANFYKAKILALGQDHLRLQTVYKKSAKSDGGDEPVTQYIPVERIKRVSVMKTTILLHL